MRPSCPEAAYGWPSIPPSLRGEPLVLVDVDGTVRGDVSPMVRLVQPMLPRIVRKVTMREPWNAHKLLHFSWGLGKLWFLRTVNRQHRRRYKHLFSELHHLAAALLRGTPVAEYREKYRRCLPQMTDLWFDDAVTLLDRLTQQAVVVLVTGSEQVQTEECVRLLAMRGVDTDRILVHGSLYGCDAETGRFHGAVEHLNVTLEGKRDAVRAFREDPTLRVAAAMGNSRPDRALLEAVHPKGLRVLVCSRSILQRRDVRTFALRKYRRSGFHLVWDLDEYRTAVDQCGDMRADDSPQPVLVTDCNYRNMLDNGQLRLECNRCLSEPHRGPAGRTAPRPLYQEAG